MRAFTCGSCRRQLVFFENTTCLKCGTPLGYLPGAGRVVALRELGAGRFATLGGADPVTGGADPGDDDVTYRRCANAAIAGCNWFVDGEGSPDTAGLCPSCALTRTRPNDGDADGMAAFAKAEAAKRRLLFQLADLGLEVASRAEDPARGLAFDLLSSKFGGVVTGHANGIITLDLAEGDDAYREQTRHELGEPYRTLLGHVRHEIGHYYWDRLVDGTAWLEGCRALFGDERADYGAALEHHYSDGPPAGWEERHVSSYATMHPFEDWAETFAHYLHVHDTLQTAAAAGLIVVGPRDEATGRRIANLAAVPDENAHENNGFKRVVAEWLPLTYALNAVNRSMGRDDLYPFVLPQAVIEKLAFVHEVVRSASGDAAPPFERVRLLGLAPLAPRPG